MLTRRVVVCLDVKGARVVKGVEFESLRDVGDPVELAMRYEVEGADEIVYLDISASAEERTTLLDVARRTAERLFIPLTIGGGGRTAGGGGPAPRAGGRQGRNNTPPGPPAGGEAGSGPGLGPPSGRGGLHPRGGRGGR